MTKQFLFSFATIGLFASASFAASPEITPAQMTCAQAQHILVTHQTAVINTTSIFGSPLKLKVVAKANCPFGTISRPIYMRTLDVRQCALGYAARCENDSAYEGGG